MDRLERDFSEEIDFFVLDVDLNESRRYLEEYAIRSRSTYVLLDGAGEEVMRWNGPLNEELVVIELEKFLETVK